MRVLVCGGRDFSDFEALDNALSAMTVSLVLHGDARGADHLAGRWAGDRGIAQVIFPANWKGEGYAAGPRRNLRMLEIGRPDVVVAFPGGKGTAHMIQAAEDAGVPVRRVGILVPDDSDRLFESKEE